MRFPLQIRAPHGIVPESIRVEIRERAIRLDHLYGRITRCSVTVEGPGPHHRKGVHRVQLRLTVPGAEIIVNRRKDVDLCRAIHETFQAAVRRLHHHFQRLRGKGRKARTSLHLPEAWEVTT